MDNEMANITTNASHAEVLSNYGFSQKPGRPNRQIGHDFQHMQRL